MPTVREACNDKSWRVRYMVADKFVEVSIFSSLFFVIANQGRWYLHVIHPIFTPCDPVQASTNSLRTASAEYLVTFN